MRLALLAALSMGDVELATISARSRWVDGPPPVWPLAQPRRGSVLDRNQSLDRHATSRDGQPRSANGDIRDEFELSAQTVNSLLTMAASWASSESVRKSMKGNRSRDTKPELAVRRLIHVAGLRYRVDYRPIPAINRRADIVFTRQRVAIYIDGCFWHGCPIHYVASRTNSDYWQSKISRNIERDTQTDMLLREHGWTPVRFWSHEAPASVADAILAILEQYRRAKSVGATVS